MLKFKNYTTKLFSRMLIIVLCAALLLTGFSTVFNTFFNSVVTNASVDYKITFTQGDTKTLFADKEITVTTNASGCLVVPETYFDIYGEQTGDYITVTSDYDCSQSTTNTNVLDCETFYFDTSGAYSFTGWMVEGTSDGDKIPEKTVFQPGDVITADVLEKIASSNAITLVALWGKCYFIQNPYTSMSYSNTSTGYYELDTSSSSGATGASDTNTGNDPLNPKATIDGLYSDLRSDSTTANPHRDYDAYATVVMLTGDLDYYKDSNRSTSTILDNNNKNTNSYIYYNYYGYGEDSSFNNGISPATEYVSATYKSLQAERVYNSGTSQWKIEHSADSKGTKYSYNYKGYGSYNRVYGNLRFDNILFKKIVKDTFPGSSAYTSEWQLYYPSGDSGLHYFETTARYNVYTENSTTNYIAYSDAGFSSFRTADHQYIVLNGGQFNNMEYYWSTNNADITRYWYIGRLAFINSYITVGCTTTSESLVITSRGDMNLTITGGRIGSLACSSKGMYAISVGNRTINIYGDGSDHVAGGNASQIASYEYSPYISNLYGGGYTSPLYGDVVINAQNCNNLDSVYGGGQDYTATTYGNVTLNITNCTIANSLYGGGQYANVEKIPSTYIQYTYDSTTGLLSSQTTGISNLSLSHSAEYGGDVEINLSKTTVGVSVYGSGMGQTQTISTLSSVIYSGTSSSYVIEKTDNGSGNWTYEYKYPANWEVEPTFPVYDDTTGYILIGSYKYITWSTASPTAVNFRRYDYYAYLSLATVQNVEINITNGSLIYGDVYGGGSIAKVLGDTEVNIEDSTVNGTVYGGGDGATTPSAVTVYKTGDGNDWKYSVDAYDSTTGIPTEVTCSGTYKGLATLTYLGTFTWSDEEYLLDLSTKGIDYDNYKIYSPNTTGLGSVVGNITVNVSGSSKIGTLYGGGNQGAVGTTSSNSTITVNVSGGEIGTLYGGCNAADVSGTVSVTVSGGSITTLYGGNNASGTISGDINVNINQDSGGTTTIGTVYGGGNEAEYGGTPTIEMTAGTVTGNVFGGGNDAAVEGTSVSISNAAIGGSVYGGGYAGAVNGATSVTISNATIGGNVYGGGFEGAVTDSTSVSISNATIGESVYGGGFEGAVTDSTSVTISNATIGESVYGGGYAGTGTVGGNITVAISGSAVGATDGGSVYGGGFAGAVTGSSSAISITITDSTTVYGDVFGGGYAGAVAGSTSVTITSSTVANENDANEYGGNVFGGGFNGGVQGTTSVTIASSTIGTTYGGSIYGGGYAGAVGGNITVEISGSSSAKEAYGGGYAGAAGGNITVTVSDTSQITDCLYGGGNQGAVDGDITVSVSGGEIGTLYGGCNAADVGGTVSVTVSGGTITTLYGGNNADGEINGNITVYVSGGTIGTVYGGGNVANYSGTAAISMSGGTIAKDASSDGSVYGGGNEADVAYTSVTISGGAVQGSVYGGGYQGDITGSTVVSISDTTSTPTISESVYGGGYAGAVSQNTEVTITGATIGESVYGGGFEGAVAGTTSVSVSNSTITENVYGGGYASSGTVGGNVTVEISGTSSAAEIYGGGYQGDVGGSTSVTVTGGTLTSIYGGGYVGDIAGSTVVSISDTTTSTTIISGSVYGAGYGEESCVSVGTTVTINLSYYYEVEEKNASANTITSGEITTEISNESGNSYIAGSVYGGGNLGTVGAGTINTSTNSATITTSAKTEVTVLSGKIYGSVYGGGYGVPANGSYNIYMGTVFGETAVTIGGDDSNDYVCIWGNVFGGGSQSRVYAETNGTAATVTITSENGSSIALGKKYDSGEKSGGSVFGGGEHSNSTKTNASVATTVGNVTVYIYGNGADTASTIYFFGSGGVYGDGSLCLVSGTRMVNIENFTMGSRTSGLLKTFYSLQRADVVNLTNSQIVLLGALDLVAEGDNTTYSINRVSTLNLMSGSTIKLDRIVNYLGKLSSDVYDSRYFINGGYNGGNSYNTNATVDALITKEISDYITNAIAGNPVFSTYYANTVCVANGLSLELRTESGGYGTVTGLFTLSLLVATPGEGGGFVYADIATSTGDFICVTEYSDNSGTYMIVVDDVGGYTDSRYTYYYWYIQGSTINYTLETTGYIGSSDTEYKEDGTVPTYDGATMYYVLYSIEVNDTLSTAIMNSTYTLVDDVSNLKDQEIAIELRIGSTSLGFLSRNGNNWYIGGKIGIANTDSGVTNKAAVNILSSFSISSTDDNTLYFVLHKSNDVNTQTATNGGMTITAEIDVYTDKNGSIGDIVSNGTSKLIISGTANIKRLVPTQKKYLTTGKNYAGIDTSVSVDSVTITSGSSFTVQYQTKYIPGAYSPSSGSMKWVLTTYGYSYYIDKNGIYMTIKTDENGNITCTSISSNTLTYSGDSSGSQTNTIYYDNGQYYYFTDLSNISSSTITMTRYALFESSVIPAGTKITMIDNTGTTAAYYYYICDDDTYEIDLSYFMVMGTSTTIGSSAAFMAAYTNGNTSTQVSEDLIFIFDFEEATSMPAGGYSVHLQHLYTPNAQNSYSTDIMDFVESETSNGTTSYTRTVPVLTTYTISGAAGYDFEAGFDSNAYYDLDEATLTVTITPDTDNINTRLSENQYAIKIELLDGQGGTARTFPVGMLFEYNGATYQIASDGKYVIIPLTGDGTHTITIVNEMYSLSSLVGDTAYFKVTLYSAPSASYYNYIEWCSVDTPYYGISNNLTYALSVEAEDSQVLSAGDTLSFSVITKVSDTSSNETVSVGIMMKNASGEYEEVAFTNLFDSGKETLAATNGSTSYCNWVISSSAKAGTYRLVFKYGDHVEYLNVIIV